VLNPWYAPNSRITRDQDYPAAEYFYSVSDWTLTQQYARASIARGTEPWKGTVLLGQVAYRQALNDTTQLQAAKLDTASSYLKQALAANPEYVPALLDLGILAFQTRQYKSALQYLEKACDTDPTNVQAHTAAAEVYKAMAGTANTRKHLDNAI
jgi:Tfp pilus assembly protein PilF